MKKEQTRELDLLPTMVQTRGKPMYQGLNKQI